MNAFTRLLGAGRRCSRQREQHVHMPRGKDEREGTSFQGHRGAIEGFRTEVLAEGGFAPLRDTG